MKNKCRILFFLMLVSFCPLCFARGIEAEIPLSEMITMTSFSSVNSTQTDVIPYYLPFMFPVKVFYDFDAGQAWHLKAGGGLFPYPVQVLCGSFKACFDMKTFGNGAKLCLVNAIDGGTFCSSTSCYDVSQGKKVFKLLFHPYGKYLCGVEYDLTHFYFGGGPAVVFGGMDGVPFLASEISLFAGYRF